MDTCCYSELSLGGCWLKCTHIVVGECKDCNFKFCKYDIKDHECQNSKELIIKRIEQSIKRTTKQIKKLIAERKRAREELKKMQET